MGLKRLVIIACFTQIHLSTIRKWFLAACPKKMGSFVWYLPPLHCIGYGSKLCWFEHNSSLWSTSFNWRLLSGRAGRNDQQATLTIFWAPLDVPKYKDLSKAQSADIVKMRSYLENVTDCRRYILLSHFDSALIGNLSDRDPLTCCDNCKEVEIITACTVSCIKL